MFFYGFTLVLSMVMSRSGWLSAPSTCSTFRKFSPASSITCMITNLQIKQNQSYTVFWIPNQIQSGSKPAF